MKSDKFITLSIVQSFLKVFIGSMKYTYYADLPTDSNYLEIKLGKCEFRDNLKLLGKTPLVSVSPHKKESTHILLSSLKYKYAINPVASD